MCFGCQVQADVTASQLFIQLAQLLVEHLRSHFPTHVMEYDGSRQTVEEFRFEGFLYLTEHGLSGAYLTVETNGSLMRILSTGVGSHDKNQVAAVRFPSFVVRQHCIVHYLQQDVENVGMSLFDFIQ